jgi:hypothetical protein
MGHGLVASTCGIETKHRNAAGTCNMDMQHGQEVWTCSMDMQQGDAYNLLKTLAFQFLPAEWGFGF